MAVRVMGFNLSHDSSACLVEDGNIRAALALERTTRIKRGTVPLHAYAGAMADLTGQILASEGLSRDDVDLWIATSTESRDAADEARLTSLLGLLAPAERVVALPHPGHHLAHASAAFYSSGFDEAAALVIDAYGSLFGPGRERESAFHFRAGSRPELTLRTVRDSERAAGYRRDGDIWMPEQLSGVGEVYRIITLALGFWESGTIYDDAGKTMGLASFGKRLSRENIFIDLLPDGELGFGHFADALVDLGVAVRQDGELRLVPRRSGTPYEQFHYDLAAQVQEEFEEACLHLTREVLRRTGSRSLVTAGGSFLNSSLNTRLLQETEIDRLFVFPAATDDGNAAGAALYAYHESASWPGEVRPAMQHVYLGPSRLSGDLESTVRRWQLPYRRHDGPARTARAAAAAIARGDIIGWFQDRSEFGPRSLGARSILCHPGIEGMKDRLNQRVKFREGFRPFAGSVLAERADKWFDMPVPESPFMLLVCPVIAAQRRLVSEIVHVDGTCRMQTVGEDTPGPFRALIEAFEDETGLPMVLNTSFNLRGMPIVEFPDQAIDCLYGSRLDRLFIGDFEVTPPDLNTLVPAPCTEEIRWSADRRSSEAAGSAGRVSDLGRQILDRADGVRSIGDIAADLQLEVDGVVDTALDLRRLRLLRWAGIPELERPSFPLAQYLPDGHA